MATPAPKGHSGIMLPSLGGGEKQNFMGNTRGSMPDFASLQT